MSLYSSEYSAAQTGTIAALSKCAGTAGTLQVSVGARACADAPHLYFFRLSKDQQATAAKMSPAALSASVRIMSRGMPRSSCATLPVIIAAIVAVAKAMIRTAALPMSRRE